jgi:hypothetical protein
MNVDTDKIDDVVLALLYLTSFEYGDGVRAWKGHSWEAMNRLFEKGMIGDPKSKAKSVWLTDEGAKRSEELFRKFFEKRE